MTFKIRVLFFKSLYHDPRILRRDGPPESKHYPEGFREPNGYWTSFYMNPATIGYNTEHVKPDEAPKKWSDLLHSRWKGQMTMDREESEWFANMLDVKGCRAPIEWVRADPVVAYHCTASVAAKGPHPNAARLFVDFLLSRKGQELIVKTKRVPVRNGVEPNPPHLVKGVRLLPSKTALAKDFKKHFAEYRRVFKVP